MGVIFSLVNTPLLNVVKSYFDFFVKFGTEIALLVNRIINKGDI